MFFIWYLSKVLPNKKNNDDSSIFSIRPEKRIKAEITIDDAI